MDSVGFPWIPSDSIRQIDIGGYHRKTFLPSMITVLFRVNRILLPLEGVKNIILPISSENYVSHWCVLKMYGKKSISTFSFF